MATWQLRAVAPLCHAWRWASSRNGGVHAPAHLTESLCLPQYFGLLLIIFLLEIIAGVLAYVYYQQVRAGTGHVRTWTCRRRTRTRRDTDTHALGHTHTGRACM